MSPVLTFAGRQVASYAVFMVVALVIGFGLFVLITVRRGIPLRSAVGTAAAAAVGGLVGGRLFAAVTADSLFFGGLGGLVEPRWGNMAMFGGLGGAAVGGAIAARLLGVPVLRLGDAAAPAVGVGIVALRTGCLCAGCCFGRVTDLPWGITYPSGSLSHGYQAAADPLALFFGARAVHPIPVYEMLAAALLAAVAFVILRRDVRDGTAAAVVAGGYALVRLIIQPLRVPEPGWTPGWFDPVMYLAVLAVAVGWLAWPRVRRASDERRLERDSVSSRTGVPV